MPSQEQLEQRRGAAALKAAKKLEAAAVAMYAYTKAAYAAGDQNAAYDHDPRRRLASEMRELGSHLDSVYGKKS